MTTLRDKIAEFQEEREANQALLMGIKNMATLEQVIARAESVGLDPQTFVAEAVIDTLNERKSIPIDIEVYNRLEARASGRGLNIDELFNRSSFQEFVLDGLQRGAF